MCSRCFLVRCMTTFRQPRPIQTPVARASAHCNPYGSPAASHRTAQIPSRQPAADAGLCSATAMSNYPEMSNSALINALLTSAANQQERQQEHRTFSLSVPFQDARSPVNHLHPSTSSANELFNLSDQDQSFEPRKQARKTGEQRPKKQQKRKAAASIDADDDYLVEAPFSDNSSPQHARRPRRSTRSKKPSAPVDPPTPEDDYQPLQEEQRPKKPGMVEKPKKARTGRLIRKKPVGIAVPKTLDEAGPPDRMMWEWKNQGKNWEEIRAEWKRLTGVEPGGSSLSVRYIKLVENLARNGAAGDIELLKFRREAEEELMSQLWPRVAEKMLAFSPESEHNPKDLQKRFNMIVRSGYDIEKLVAEDEIKHEKNPKQPQHLTKTSEYPDNFHMEFDTIASYNNPVANETLARLREGDTSASDGHNSQYADELPAIARDDHADIFTHTRTANQQVDGLSEHTRLDTSDYHIQGDPDMKYPIASGNNVQESPLTVQKSGFRQQTDAPYLTATSSLVGYGSDSE